MNDVILLACFLKDNIKPLTDCLNMIQGNRKECKVFIGINHNSILETESIIESYSGLDVTFERQSAELTIDSDASAFQKALELMSMQEYQYKNTYFIHTKGASTGDTTARNHYLDILLHESFIDKVFEKHGSYGIDICRSKEPAGRWQSQMEYVCDVPHKTKGYFYPHTFFCIKGSIMKVFLRDLKKEFFTTNINDYSNRYFAEWHLGQLAQYYGKRPYYENFLQIRDRITDEEIKQDFNEQ
jgi:hypothetical protein